MTNRYEQSASPLIGRGAPHMDEFREGLGGRLADLITRAVVRAGIRQLRERDRRDTWLNVANRQLEERLAPYNAIVLAAPPEPQADVEEPEAPQPISPQASAPDTDAASRPRRKFEAI